MAIRQVIQKLRFVHETIAKAASSAASGDRLKVAH
jgi:hypothetical protein